MDKEKKGFREIFFAQIVALMGGLFVGIVLAAYTDKLLLIPGFLILLPGFFEMRGGISGTLATRLSSGLFLGFIKPNKMNERIIHKNILASFILVVCVSLFLGVLAYLFTYFFLGVSYPKIIIYSLSAALLANLIGVPMTLFFTFYFYKKGYDPDNIMGPFISTLGDITSIISLLVVILVI